MLGIEDRWVAPVSRLCLALPVSLLMLLVSSFMRKPRETHLSFCFSSNKKNTEEIV